MYETPNGYPQGNCNPKVDPEQNNCSDDILEFTSTPTGELTITIGGVPYAFSLVSSGFTSATGNPATCPATPVPPTKTKFITTEGTTTTGCLYGKLAQKRSITLVKKVEWTGRHRSGLHPELPIHIDQHPDRLALEDGPGRPPADEQQRRNRHLRPEGLPCRRGDRDDH